ncbi:MAG: hypothetical protein EON60_12135 [Alphaproteobacteria bacterium]|nr:MAG: hypothetical protein EON60_12135 [Alphaproteobacteria bacterium]
MPIDDVDLKKLADEATKTKQNLMELIRRKYPHLEEREVDWAAMRAQVLLKESKGVTPQNAFSSMAA